MHRVDYLHARISQLRFRQLPYSWAVYLARLEQGERPSGQPSLPTIPPGKLFQILRRDIADSAPVVWRSPAPIAPQHGRILALLLRAATTAKNYRERSHADGVSVLTATTLAIVAPAFGFMSSQQSDRLPKTREFEYWLLRNKEDAALAQAALLELVDKKELAGFASYDG